MSNKQGVFQDSDTRTQGQQPKNTKTASLKHKDSYPRTQEQQAKKTRIATQEHKDSLTSKQVTY